MQEFHSSFEGEEVQPVGSEPGGAPRLEQDLTICRENGVERPAQSEYVDHPVDLDLTICSGNGTSSVVSEQDVVDKFHSDQTFDNVTSRGRDYRFYPPADLGTQLQPGSIGNIEDSEIRDRIAASRDTTEGMERTQTEPPQPQSLDELRARIEQAIAENPWRNEPGV